MDFFKYTNKASLFCFVFNGIWNRLSWSLSWKGPLKGHLVQLACKEQGHLQLEQVAQSLGKI